MASISFTADANSIIPNPERGWYLSPADPIANPSGWAADCTDIANGTTGFNPGSGVVTEKMRLVLGVCDLPQTALSGGQLTNLQSAFNAARSAGVKIIWNFRYGTSSNPEPAVSQIVAHLNQLKPLLFANRDVIYADIMALFGPWGEGDSGTPADKKTVWQTLLSVVPPEIPILLNQVYPMEDYLAGLGSIDDTKAYSGSPQARSGGCAEFCFMTGQGNSSHFPGIQTNIEGYNTTHTEAQQRQWQADNTRFAPFGGETCQDSSGASLQMRNTCSGNPSEPLGAGGILNEGPRYHLSFLNRSYAQLFINNWTTGGCIATVTNLMGYRIQFETLNHADTVARGGVLSIALTLRNVGWARAHAARSVMARLVNGGTVLTGYSSARLNQLPPLSSASSRFIIRIPIPANAPTGSYALTLEMPDIYPTTAAIRAFKVRPAISNSGSQVWDDTNGRMATGTTATVT